MRTSILLLTFALLSCSGCELLGFNSDSLDDVISMKVLLAEPIQSHHSPAGIFHSTTVSVHIPDEFGEIVITVGPDAVKPFGVDDELHLTISPPQGEQINVQLQRNGASGLPIGEQFILSNVVTFTEGTYTIKADWWNIYAPPGGNASASSAFLVVLREKMDR